MAQWHRNIQDIITIIDACIRAQQDEALTLRALAQKLGYSEYYTSRKFRELAGMTLRAYLRLFLQRGLHARVQKSLRREPQRLPGHARPRRAPDHPAAV